MTNIFNTKEGTKSYCASCGKIIKIGDFIAFSSDKKGNLKMHHLKKCKR